MDVLLTGADGFNGCACNALRGAGEDLTPSS